MFVLWIIYAGTLRDIEKGTTDFVFGTRLFIKLGTQNCAFLSPLDITNMKYVTRKSSKEEKLLSFHVLQAFDTEANIIYFAATLSFMLVWLFVDLAMKKIGQIENTLGIVKTALAVVSIQSSASVSLDKYKTFPHRILITVLLITALIMTNSFQGLIVRNLTSPKKSNDVNTLKELIERNFKLSAMVLVPNLFKPLDGDLNVNQIQKQIYFRQTPNLAIDFEKIRNVDEKSAILSKNIFIKALQKLLTIYFTVREGFTMEAAAKFFDPNTGEDTIHVIKESPISFIFSYVVPKTSPFIAQLNRALNYAREFGIYERTRKKMDDYLQLVRIRRFKVLSSHAPENQKIKLHHLEHVFFFYLICLSICCFTFLIEITAGRLYRRKCKVEKLRTRAFLL